MVSRSVKIKIISSDKVRVWKGKRGKELERAVGNWKQGGDLSSCVS